MRLLGEFICFHLSTQPLHTLQSTKWPEVDPLCDLSDLSERSHRICTSNNTHGSNLWLANGKQYEWHERCSQLLL